MSFQRYLIDPATYDPGRSTRSLIRALWSIKYNAPTFYTIQTVHALLREIEEMTRTRKNARERQSSDKSFRFLNVSIEDADYDDVMDFAREGDKLLEALVMLMETGYKFSFSLNNQNDLFVCAMTDRRVGSQTENTCLTGAADSWYDALRVCLYKHTIILKQDWANHEALAVTKRRIM